jgi:phage-related protein
MEILDSFTLSSEISHSYKVETKTIELGDNLRSVTLPTGQVIQETWQLKSAFITEANWNAINNKLKGIAAQEFQYRMVPTDPLTNWYCKTWSGMRMNPNWFVASLTLVRAHNESLAVKIGTTSRSSTVIPMFPLNVFRWDFTNQIEIKAHEKKIDGGVEERAIYSYNAVRDSWTVSRFVTTAEKTSVTDFLKTQCGRSFQFKITPDAPAGKIYTCYEWAFSHLDTGLDYWQFSATFTREMGPYKTPRF